VEGFPSGQRDQTVNLTAQPSKVQILLPPPFLCFISQQLKATQSNSKQFKAIQSNSKQFKAIQSNSKQFKAIQSNSKQFKAIQSNSKQNFCRLTS
jgi:hypothetical protein